VTSMDRTIPYLCVTRPLFSDDSGSGSGSGSGAADKLDADSATSAKAKKDKKGWKKDKKGKELSSAASFCEYYNNLTQATCYLSPSPTAALTVSSSVPGHCHLGVQNMRGLQRVGR